MSTRYNKSFVASTAIDGYLVVKAAGDGTKLALATAATDLLMGAADSMGAEAGGALDLGLAGIGEVRLGGNIAFGEPLTANAASKAIKALPANSTQVRIIGYALAAGVAEDIIPYHIALGQLSKASA